MSHDSEWWKRVEEAYHAVRELRGEERSRFLNEACASDAAMRRQIEVLLQQDENPDSLLNTTNRFLRHCRRPIDVVATFAEFRFRNAAARNRVWLLSVLVARQPVHRILARLG